MSPQREASGRDGFDWFVVAGCLAGIAFNGALLAYSVVLLALVACRRDAPPASFGAAFASLAVNAAMVGWWASRALRLLSPVPTGEGTGA